MVFFFPTRIYVCAGNEWSTPCRCPKKNRGMQFGLILQWFFSGHCGALYGKSAAPMVCLRTILVRICENVVRKLGNIRRNPIISFQYLNKIAVLNKKIQAVAVAGVGKIGPWFEYVNGPFMLQSRRGGNSSGWPSCYPLVNLYSLRTGKSPSEKER